MDRKRRVAAEPVILDSILGKMVNQTSQQIANDLAGQAFSNDARHGPGESLKHDMADRPHSGFTEFHGGKSIQKERSMLAELDPNHVASFFTDFKQSRV